MVIHQTGPTLTAEWNIWDIYVIDMWNLMFLANYQFNDFFALTFRYSPEDLRLMFQGEEKGRTVLLLVNVHHHRL